MHIHALKKEKQGYTQLFNIGFTIKGCMLYVGPNTKNKKKVFCKFIYQHWDNGQWTLEISPIVNANVLKKREKAYTMWFGLWPSGQWGTCYILAQIQRRRKSSFVI